MKRMVAQPKSFPLFSTTTRTKRPRLAEIDAALLVIDTLLAKQVSSSSPTIWDMLAGLKLPATQESWVRALIMDVAGASPFESDPRAREASFRTYLTRARKELRTLQLDLARKGISASPFTPLERFFS
jgi:hypothetical protein